MDKIKFLKTAGIIFIISLFLEIFVFNFRFFTTLSNKEIEITPEILYGNEEIDENSKEGLYAVLSGGIKYNKEFILDADTGEYKPLFKIIDKNNAFLEIKNINEEADNIYINIKSVGENKKTVFKIKAADEANELYFNLPKRDIVRDVERSKYINFNLSGKSEKLKLEMTNVNDRDEFIFGEIKINAGYPMMFSFIRLFAVFLIILIVYAVRPESSFYKYSLNLKSIGQRTVIAVIVLAHALGFIYLSCLNPGFVNIDFEKFNHHKQYYQLTDAILNGRTYLDIEPSEKLKSMSNPYDAFLRESVLEESEDNFSWDKAYYNGKYYVYFGIVPVLIYYLPFKIITGEDFPTYMGISLTAIILMLAVLGLMNRIMKRYFKNTPFILYVLLSFFLIDGCGIIYLLKRPDFYSLPIIMALAFSAAGLYFWVSSIKYKDVKEPKFTENKKRFNGFILWRLTLGSLCMALVAGCRPQVLIGSFLAVPLFYKITFKERRLFSRTSIKETIVFLLPYIIVASGIMWYNYIRFDSVFNFGANYNLTSNDMTKRGFVLGRTALGLFTYLFQPPAISAEFPFISRVSFYTSYMGRTINDLYLYGGIFLSHFLLTINVFIFKLKNILKSKGLFYFCVLCIIFSVFIVIADTQAAGILKRYYIDFSWLMFIPCIIIVLTILERAGRFKLFLTTALLIGLSFSFYYDFASIFIYEENTLSLKDMNPTFYYTAAHLVLFWL